MKIKALLPLSLLLILSACGGADEESTADTESTEPEYTVVEGYPQTNPEAAENEPVATMETSEGTIKIKLFPDQAPKAVENFMTHSEDGYYDGLTFHRVIEGFMIQGGDPEGTGAGGESIYGEPFEDEFNESLINMRGALSMANSGPNTNGSQFFIVQADSVAEDMIGQMEDAEFPQEIIDIYAERGGTPWLDNRHTVFGQVIEGMDVVDQIAAAEVVNDVPEEEIVIESITIEE
ncbi:peptidylprolyl isomerase [Jeotgalibacillus haloalkalitolerans]|uniref:Peptidyl-prolyl cis-trans isomerase n=1 Tax=Jeotgalibacillus haloalkalitolerans TaxID=3104292 RepID=A0ABU5KQX5_9BACL|nr:peptidylprolyl isomerase [Jeotgalibacillus sp. HH7-29]MDZ5713647.1 peptidylprolyl isomerase [Jeotgalibacillus sp. HH7-29]